VKVGSPGGKTPVNPTSAAASSRYGRSMRTRDDIWMQDGDAWGVDLLAWEEDEDEPVGDPDDAAGRQPEDPRS
jgi:hypothetical protein